MRTLLIAAALLAFSSAALACDVCGCSIGGNYFGILPQFHRNFVGLRWSGQSFQSAHSRSAANSGRFESEEQFRTLDVMGRFYPSRRLQLMALVPYHDFRQMEGSALTHTQGLGDVTLLGNYILLNTGDSLHHRWQHTLTAGAGVKVPTGRHDLTGADGALQFANMQPGTGSYDFLLSATYTIRRGAWGLSTDFWGRLNTANKQAYQFGHRASGSAKFFYWKNLRRKLALLPNAGVFADAAQADHKDNIRAEGTGGFQLLATTGLDVYAGPVSIGFTFQQPVYQLLDEGKIRAHPRWMATFNYMF